MKYDVTRFKSLKSCLKELEPFILNGKHLQTGKPFKRFGGLRSRELLANWLLCVVVNSKLQADQFTFSSDPIGSDGLIVDTATGEAWPTEHVLIPAGSADKGESIESLILKAISKKQSKGGAAYASGKTLVVFLNANGGQWFPNVAARHLPRQLDFDAVWVVCLHSVELGEYTYGVTRLDLSRGNAPGWMVRIGKEFDHWTVVPVQ